MYAVEFSHRSGRDLINVAKRRTNIIPIVEDARYPLKYRMLVPMVDVIFADVAQPDQARIVGINAQYFLKNGMTRPLSLSRSPLSACTHPLLCFPRPTGGHFVISIKANCIDSTAAPEAVFASEIKKLQTMKFKPHEYVTLEPYERDHAVVSNRSAASPLDSHPQHPHTQALE